MDRSGNGFFCIAFLALLVQGHFTSLAEAQGVGVNYGMKGNNLPPPSQVVALCKSKNIKILRLFDPNPTALAALHGSGIAVVLGTLNEDLPGLATDPSAAAAWVAANVLPHAGDVTFRYVSAGNEVIPGDLAKYVLPAMKNLDAALTSAGVPAPVTTSVAASVLGKSFPPSQGAFSDQARPIMEPITAHLAAHNAPLMVNVYPYFAHASDPKNVALDYALFGSGAPVVRDGELVYNNLFDAMVDAVHTAVDGAGGGGVEVVVSETGWPWGGGGESDATTIENARIYNSKLVEHVMSDKGTPKRPGKGVETYLFALFNENQKPEGTEQHFGIYQPDMTPVYTIDFSTR